MKLYILTSTLNLTSIFATESCSPLACYKNRSFGSKDFYSGGSFAKENSIVLFDKYPYYVFPQTNEEQYTLVIEVETEKCAHFDFEKICDKNKVGLYQTSQTIYLNPIGCKFIFDKSETKDVMLSRAKVHGLEAKPVFYEKLESCVCQDSYAVEQFNYSKEIFTSIPDTTFNDDNLKRDQRLNKCKGLLYAYIIGANISPGEGVSQLYKLAKEIGNIVYARVVNDDTSSAEPRLETLTEEFNQKAREYAPIYSCLSESASRLNVSPTERLIEEIKTWDGVWNVIQEKIFQLPKLQNINNIDNWKDEESRVNQWLRSQKRESIFVDEIPSIDDFLPVTLAGKLSTEEKRLYIEWIKIFIDPSCTLRAFYANKSLYLVSAGKMAKELMGQDVFGISKEREYYNSLIRNIKEAEPFDLCSIESIIWRSLAICAKATNTEVEALESLLITYAFADYRYALALWGAMCGYADMPRTFFNRILGNVKLDVAFAYVKAVYKKLTSLDLEEIQTKRDSEKFEEFKLKEPHASSNGIDKDKIRECANDVLKKLKTKKKLMESLNGALKTCHEDMTILDFLQRLRKTDGWAKKNGQPVKAWEDMRNSLCPEAGQFQKEPNEQSLHFEEDLGSEMPGKVDLREEVMDSENLQSRRTSAVALKGECDSSPLTPTSSNFVDDKNAAGFILSRPYLHNKIGEILSQKVVFFQKNYDPQKGYYVKDKKESRGNDNTINHFICRCTSTKGGTDPWISPTDENKNLLEQLEQELNERYGNR